MENVSLFWDSGARNSKRSVGMGESEARGHAPRVDARPGGAGGAADGMDERCLRPLEEVLQARHGGARPPHGLGDRDSARTTWRDRDMCGGAGRSSVRACGVSAVSVVCSSVGCVQMCVSWLRGGLGSGRV